ncbi:hypothetical protein KA005_48155 [bacterium]|nr:hypothetical protein [bacterium]
MKPVTKRNIYKETVKEVKDWAKKMREAGLLDRSPDGKDSFPFCLEQYIKFHVRK